MQLFRCFFGIAANGGFDFTLLFDGTARSTGAAVVIITSLLTVYILTVVLMLCYSFINCLVLFNKTMFSNQGYLMRTLPVTPAQQLLSKLLVSFIWFIISYICFAVLFAMPPFSLFNKDSYAPYTGLRDFIFGSDLSEFVLKAISVIINFVHTQLMLIAALTIANRLTNSHRSAVCIAVLFALNMLVTTVYAFIARFNDIFFNIESIYSGDISEYVTKIIFSVAYFIYVCRQLNGRLDLE